MANFRLCATNAIDEALLTANPVGVATLPPYHLQLPARGRIFKTTSPAVQELKFTWGGQGHYMNFLMLNRHNLEAGAQWRVQLFSDANWTNSFYNSGLLPAFQYSTLAELQWGVSPLGNSIFNGHPQFSILYFTRAVALSGIVSLHNTGNSNGYLAASRLFGGDYMEMQWNPEASDWGWDEETKQSRAPTSGTLRSDAGAPFRSLDLQLSFTDEVQRARLADLLYSGGMRKDMFVALFPGAGSYLERDYTFLGKMTGKLPKVSHKAGTNVMRSAFQFQEV